VVTEFLENINGFEGLGGRATQKSLDLRRHDEETV